jgi:proline iminopeptidase
LSAGLIEVGGTRLFVDDRGDPEAPPLLFIHGGPGQGCYDFMRSQGDLLASRLRLIGVDQRGTLRSDPLPGSPALTADLLVGDFEALRDQLGIGSWAILGHSAGGGYALRYAASRPQAVRAAIFDCPCWDADLTDRHRLPEIARRLETLGQLADAERCRELAAKAGRLTAGDGCRQAAQALGPHFMEQFFYDPGGAADFARLLEVPGFSEEQWERGDSHQPLVAALYEPAWPLLSRVACPDMLMRGAADLVAAPELVAEFGRLVPAGAVLTFAHSGHFPYLEQPAEYCQAVTGFVLEHCT